MLTLGQLWVRADSVVGKKCWLLHTRCWVFWVFLETTAPEHLYYVISNNVIVLKHCFLSPCFGPFLSLGLRQGFQICSKVVHKQLNLMGTEWWGLGFQRDAENTVAPIEAEGNIVIISLPATEISALLCIAVSSPHSQSFWFYYLILGTKRSPLKDK